MALRGPLVTAVVTMVGLVALVTVNSAGGLVVEGTAAPAAAEPAVTTPTTTGPPASSPAPAPAFPAEVVYAGRANNSQLAIAVAVKGGQAAAYLCDGRGVEAWLRGTAADGKVELSSKDGLARLTGALDGGNLTGTASARGQEYPFTIGVANPPAGLYRGRDGSTTIGWIVLPDGTQVGIATTGNSSAPAPELDPQDGAATVDGRQIEAGPVAGDTTFG